ncbi:hypothetical protein [Zhongshania marina]|uniref:Uncharacterized protein n=1 Tax=Zhongshania marina TaxID=2304603 RepID=A0ABX9W4C4_9GAMM|nr:hypothetical protein D0911_06225 [Zhongshania marina]
MLGIFSWSLGNRERPAHVEVEWYLFNEYGSDYNGDETFPFLNASRVRALLLYTHRWMAYMTVWAAILYVPGALLPFFPDGPFSWEGIISFWMVAVVLFVWIAVAWWLTVRSIKSAPAS